MTLGLRRYTAKGISSASSRRLYHASCAPFGLDSRLLALQKDDDFDGRAVFAAGVCEGDGSSMSSAQRYLMKDVGSVSSRNVYALTCCEDAPECQYRVEATIQWGGFGALDANLYGTRVIGYNGTSGSGSGFYPTCYWDRMESAGFSLNVDASIGADSPETITGDFTGANLFNFWWGEYSSSPTGSYPDIQRVTVTNTGTTDITVGGGLVLHPGSSTTFTYIPGIGAAHGFLYGLHDQSNRDDLTSVGFGPLNFSVVCGAVTSSSGNSSNSSGTGNAICGDCEVIPLQWRITLDTPMGDNGCLCSHLGVEHIVTLANTCLWVKIIMNGVCSGSGASFALYFPSIDPIARVAFVAAPFSGTAAHATWLSRDPFNCLGLNTFDLDTTEYLGCDPYPLTLTAEPV